MSVRKVQMIIQVALLLILLIIFGLTFSPWRILVVFSGALITQFLGDRINQRNFNFQSALITSLTLLLLLRTNSLAFDFLAATIAILSKFILRLKDQHLFNPGNFAIVLFLFLGWGWVSPMQWGQNFYLVMAFVLFAAIVCYRAKRLDVPLVFLVVSFGLLFYRHIIFLGDPMPIFFHRISIMTIYVFAFLMISDPKTTPRHRGGRMLWVAMVAFLSFVIESHYFIRNGTLYVLFFSAPIHVMFNYFMPGDKYLWNDLAHSS